MEFKKDYFVDASNELGKSIDEYYAESACNYVIIEDNDFVIKWDDDDRPVIFGSFGDALATIEEWEDADSANVMIMTEREFIDIYCKKELMAVTKKNI